MTPALRLFERQIAIPSSQLLATIEPQTFDKAARTFQVVAYAGAAITRYNWMRDEVYEQTLEVTPEACDLSRFANGKAPFLLDHRTWSVRDNVAGVIASAWLKDGKLFELIRMSGREDFEGILRDIADGILCNVSIGADIYESREVTAQGAKTRRFQATRWKPHETSLVAVGADQDAVVLSHGRETHPCTFFFASDPMDETQIAGTPATTTPATATAAAAGTGTPTPAVPIVAPALALAAPPVAPAVDQVAAERARVLEIQRIGARFQIAAPIIAGHIQNGTPIDAVRAAFIDASAAADERIVTAGQAHVGREAADGMVAAMEECTLHRCDPARFKLTTPRAKTFVGLSLVELARECLEVRGHRHRGLSRSEVVQLALMSTSDFPELLANVAKKTLRMGYMNYPSRYADFVRVVPVMDFKQIASISMGDAPKLTKVLEHGTFTRGSLTESAEKYSIATYGKVLALTRQAIVNDDLNAFSRIPEMLGGAAAALVADLVFAILTTNAALSDAVALFNATHGNLGTKALSIAALDEMRVAMRKQTGPNGQQLNVQPKGIIVPAALETTAAQLLNKEIYAATVGNNNVFRGTLDMIVEPRLDAAGSAIIWFGYADPSQMDTIQLSYLEGNDNGPMIESRVGFDVDGVEIKVRMDVGAAPVESKGLYKSTGAT